MPYEPFSDPKYWRDRAEEARTYAERMKQPDIKRMMLRAAEDQDKIAEMLERIRDRDNNND